jgi:hypothetical protein
MKPMKKGEYSGWKDEQEDKPSKPSKPTAKKKPKKKAIKEILKKLPPSIKERVLMRLKEKHSEHQANINHLKELIRKKISK